MLRHRDCAPRGQPRDAPSSVSRSTRGSPLCRSHDRSHPLPAACSRLQPASPQASSLWVARRITSPVSHSPFPPVRTRRPPPPIRPPVPRAIPQPFRRGPKFAAVHPNSFYSPTQGPAGWSPTRRRSTQSQTVRRSGSPRAVSTQPESTSKTSDPVGRRRIAAQPRSPTLLTSRIAVPPTPPRPNPATPTPRARHHDPTVPFREASLGRRATGSLQRVTSMRSWPSHRPDSGRRRSPPTSPVPICASPVSGSPTDDPGPPTTDSRATPFNAR